MNLILSRICQGARVCLPTTPFRLVTSPHVTAPTELRRCLLARATQTTVVTRALHGPTALVIPPTCCDQLSHFPCNPMKTNSKSVTKCNGIPGHFSCNALRAARPPPPRLASQPRQRGLCSCLALTRKEHLPPKCLWARYRQTHQPLQTTTILGLSGGPQPGLHGRTGHNVGPYGSITHVATK